MPIELFKDQPDGLTIFRSDGEIRPRDIMAAMERFYKSPTRDALWDLGYAAIGRIRVEDWIRMAYLIEKRGKFGKAAIVAPKDMKYGLSSAVEAYTFHLPIKFMVFNSIEEARDWLGREDERVSLSC